MVCPLCPFDAVLVYVNADEMIPYFEDVLKEVGCRGKVINVTK